MTDMIKLASNEFREIAGLERYTKEELVLLREKRYSEIMNLIDPDFLRQHDRAKVLRGAYYKGMSPENTMNFIVPSSNYAENGITYDIQVAFDDWEKYRDDDTISRHMDKARLMINNSDMRVRCSCPSFQFHYAYVTTMNDAIIDPPENRPAPIRNPRNRGIVCKHLNRVLKTIPYNASRLGVEMKNQVANK